MISFNAWHYSVAFLAVSIYVIFINFSPQESFNFETSVWCFNSSEQTKLCRFKNICYDPQFQAFLFFLSENSVIKGFNNYKELQKIELSSVQKHNRFYANLSVIDIKNFKLSKELKIYTKVSLLSRFKPNNLMHCIHDDLLPLYLTLEFVCLGEIKCMESFSLMFHDNHPRGPFFYLYKLFSEHTPILLNDLILNSKFLLCFNEILSGLVQDSVVYQYGFKKPHGPIKSTQLTSKDISRFTLFLKNKLKISSEGNNTAEIILLNRQKNRKILNIKAVKEMIKHCYKKLKKEIHVKQIDLNLFSNDVKALLEIISQADGLIGMHGAEMILSLFLKPNSFVLEIFPYGINPEIVSFIKPISKLSGCNFIYFSWKNMLKNNSVAHADAPSLFGGISHLDETTQMSIKNTLIVPAVECCNNPLFLYHMYQDTLISNEFESFFYETLSRILKHQPSSDRNEIIKKWFHPYKVSNISCTFQQQRNLLNISWHPPFNIKKHDLIYSLYIKDKKNLFNKDISTEKTNLQVETPSGVETTFELWISVYFGYNHFKSPDLYINCN